MRLHIKKNCIKRIYFDITRLKRQSIIVIA